MFSENATRGLGVGFVRFIGADGQLGARYWSQVIGTHSFDERLVGRSRQIRVREDRIRVNA